MSRTRGGPTSKAPVVEIVIGSRRWSAQRGVGTTLRRAIAEAARLSTSGGELAIVLSHDSAIRALNRTWRGKDTPTNVLSFPANARTTGGPPFLGDIVLAYQTLAREAAAEGKPFRHHLAHLAVHGYLHLLGHDHETGREARAMERLEIAILARMGIPNPYVAQPPKG